MSAFNSELSGSLIFRSGSSLQAALNPGDSKLDLTGSLNITGSTLTFNGSDLITRIVNLEAGGSGVASLGPLNAATASLYAYTASNDIDSASLDDRLDSLETSASSAQSSIASLNSATSSYLATANDVQSLGFLPTASSGLVSGSSQIEALGFVTSSVAEIPAGTISSSAQLNSLGYISDSGSFASTGSNSFSGSQTFTGSVNITGSLLLNGTPVTASGGGGGSVPSGTVSSSAQITAVITDDYISASAASSGFGSGGGGGGDVSYDGNRIISQDKLPSLFSASFNPGTSGSVQDFLNAVFYPNSAPSFTSTGSFFVAEFATSGSTVGTLTATDPEGQSLTFRTGSSYTDDFVLVASDGTITLKQSPTTENFNTTDRGDGVSAHAVSVDALDSFGSFTSSTVYIVINANEAPVFRQTSTVGSIITSFTVSRNENAGATEVGKIYFTDPEGDVITIESSSIPSEFTVTKYGTYVQIDQATGSLDFETTSSFQFSLTASDAKYQAGTDLQASASIPVTINVTDNVIPVVNDQTLGTINENSSNGATVGTIAASDAESDTITFRNFTLSKLEIDNVDVPTGTYGGTSQLTDPHEDPFQMTSAGLVTRKTGVYLNSDLINEYQYTVEVVDSFNTASDAGTITINIADDTAASLSDNWSAGPYIIESALAGNNIVTTSGGSTQADYDSNQSGTWASSNEAITIDSNGSLTITNNISGSTTGSGDTIASTITFTNTFGTTTTDNLSVNVTLNSSPSASFTNQTGNFNTNEAVSGSSMVTFTITESETDTPYTASITGTDAAKLNLVPQNIASSSWDIQAVEQLVTQSYSYNVAITDSFGKSSSYNGRSFTIAAAETGTLGTNGTFYVIESATNGNEIKINSNGRTGGQGTLSVTYDSSQGSPSVQSFTSSNAFIAVDNSGNLSVGTSISGSGNTTGGTLNSNITFTDDYGNVGSGSISVNITTNNAPDITFTNTSGNLNTNLARSGSTLTTLTFSDTESDTIQYDDFVGAESAGLNFKRSGTSFLVQPTGSLAAGSYTISGSITDNHGFSTNTEAHSFTIAAADTGTLAGDTAIYIIESALSGSVFRDATGYNNGNAAQISVGYSPSYGSPAATNFSSSNNAIVVDSSGNLTLAVTLSGSATQSGDTFNTTITYNDQYGNAGSGTVTATVFGNQSPVANFTAESNMETSTTVSGSSVGTLTVSDTESDTPFEILVGGTDGAKFLPNGTSSPFTIRPTGSLAAGTYYIDITVTDDYGETVTLSNESFVITQSLDYGQVYVYLSPYGSDAGLTNNYLAVMGASTVNSDTPPEVTAYTANTSSPFYKLKSGDVGSSTITLSGPVTATLVASGSGTDLDGVLDNMGNITAATTGQVIIVYPSGSDMTVPTSIQESFNSTAGGAVPCMNVDGNGFGIESGDLHSITLDSAHLGYSEWFVFGRKSRNSVATSFKMRLVAANGSLPS